MSHAAKIVEKVADATFVVSVIFWYNYLRGLLLAPVMTSEFYVAFLSTTQHRWSCIFRLEDVKHDGTFFF